MASLIILSTIIAAIPMDNMNLVENAIASEMHSYRYENSQEYEKSYYSDNENNYRANYDDNYYYQDQQKQQPSYNNNYGYEDNKKISYSNSYDNDNSQYSNYPTKDKKYVCQTGQFEGFFVESVEFCLSHNKPPAPSTPVNNNSSIVNSFTCVNPNIININTDTNQSSSSLNGLLPPIQSATAQGLNGNLDELSQIDLNKAIVNLCIINDNDKIVIEDGKTTDGIGNVIDTCGEGFTEILNPSEISEVEQAVVEKGVQLVVGGEPRPANSIEELCDGLNDSTTQEESSNLLTLHSFLTNNTDLNSVLVQSIIKYLADIFDVPH